MSTCRAQTVSMCIECERIAPRCPDLVAENWEDYCAGWDLSMKETLVDENEFCEICDHFGLKYDGAQEDSEADPEEPPKRLVILRTGMTAHSPRVSPLVARWDAMAINSPGALRLPQVKIQSQRVRRTRRSTGSR